MIWCPPGHKHWHGATATTAMTHIAIQEAHDWAARVYGPEIRDKWDQVYKKPGHEM